MRSLHYDILRIIACIMVIMTHSPIPGHDWYGPLLSGLSYFCTPCIGLFFMISGALLLNRYYDNFNAREFLKKRFTKVLWPTLIWSGIGFLLTYLGVNNSENAILWFMFTLSGLYLLTPILYRWLIDANKREIEFYLLIWSISLCYPILRLFFDLNEDSTSWIYYFHGYAGYFILGYYLSKFETDKAINIGFTIAFLLFSIVFPIISVIFKLNLDFFSCFGYLSISVMFQCFAWWLFIKQISCFFECFRYLIEFLSKLSFGIYLVHILIMRNLLWNLSWLQSISGFMQILICTIITFILSVLVSWFISKTKYSKFLIGV